jgi:23S rRNA U2552 (ribose-2'-O)-methylase RlmE/FtsJ
MEIKISVLLVNLNNLSYTKQCLEDLLNQDIVFNLRLVDQNSSETGTKEFFDSFFTKHLNGDFYGKINYLEFSNTGFNKPLNHLWNDYVKESSTEFICLLNNDVRISPNFLSSSISVLEKEPSVGFVNHVTNNLLYSTWSNSLEYVTMETPYRQGWDPTFRKSSYNQIPENLNFFYGDDFIYSKLYESGYKGAYILNSPMVHFECSTTIEKGGQRDCSDDGNVFQTLDLEYKNLTFNESLCKWKPEFFEIKNKDTFLNYKNIFLGQTPNITTVFSSIIKDYDCIIEIGYHRGGLSLWLNDNKKNNCNLYCFDISDENRLVNDNENINFIVSDCLLNKTISQVNNIIQNSGKTLVLCDGGNKELEFEIYSKYLKTGDVIMLHDYSHDNDDYIKLSQLQNWVSVSESHYNNIKDIVSKNNLEPFYYDEFKSVFWGSFIKKEQPLLSILVCSLVERNNTFLSDLIGSIEKQIIGKPVELLILSDNAKRPVGTKRNNLLNISKGRYVCFIDDDDRISETYVDDVLQEIIDWSPDVIVFDAEITFNGINPKLVKYGREYDYCEKSDAYYRHPNHLMVHKKENITEFFKDIKTGEDDEWASRMLPKIVTQSRIDKILYYYDYNTSTKKYFD